jgi:anti-sigma factor RsiW
MSRHVTDSLSDYLDEELDLSRREELEAHLLDCAECAATLDELRRVVMRARELPHEPSPELSESASEPMPDLWPGIEAAIATRPRVKLVHGSGWNERRVTFTFTQLAAACLAIAIVSGTAVWYARTTGRHDAGQLIPGSDAVTAVAPAATTPAATTAAVEELRRALANGRDDLDPGTVQTLEESLITIEVAILQARRALDADPRNSYVRAHLDETMRRKVELLHRATMLASAPR